MSNKKRYLLVRDSATDAAWIDADRVTDLEVTSATAFNINFSNNDNGDGTVAITADDSIKAIKELARLIATSNTDIIVADDVDSIYMAGVTATGSITHS